MIKKFKSSINVVIGIFFIILIAISYIFVKYQLNIAIQNSTEAGNAVLTRVFVNETWTEITPLLPEPGANLEEIKSNPNIKTIDAKVRKFISYTDVVKVKLYNVKGVTVYSSEFPQIGEDKSKNPGFLDAVRGVLSSELIYRGHFGAFDQEIYNRNLVSTYAPIRDGYQIVAVAEIYSDRTASIQTTNILLNKFLAYLIISCLILFIAIMYFIKRLVDDNSKEYSNLILKSTPSESTSQLENANWFETKLNKYSLYCLNNIHRLVQFVNVGTAYRRKGKIDEQYLLSEILNLSSRISSDLKFTNYICSLKNGTYIPVPQLINLSILIEDLKLYISEQTNLDPDKIIIYLSDDGSADSYQDVTFLDLFFKTIFNFLTDLKFAGVVQIKIFRIESAIEIMTIIDLSSFESDDFHSFSNFLSFYSTYTNTSSEMNLNTRLSKHSAFINLKLQPLVLSAEVSLQVKKVGLLFDNEFDVSLIKLMLEQIGIQFIVVDIQSSVGQAIKNNDIDFLIIDSDYLKRDAGLSCQIQDIIISGLLSKKQVLLVQPGCHEFQNTLDLPFITLPFSFESLCQKLNITIS